MVRNRADEQGEATPLAKKIGGATSIHRREERKGRALPGANPHRKKVPLKNRIEKGVGSKRGARKTMLQEIRSSTQENDPKSGNAN